MDDATLMSSWPHLFAPHIPVALKECSAELKQASALPERLQCSTLDRCKRVKQKAVMMTQSCLIPVQLRERERATTPQHDVLRKGVALMDRTKPTDRNGTNASHINKEV